MKKLICLLLILMMCLAAAGCAVRDPGPPSGVIFVDNSVEGYFNMTDALELSEEELKAYLDATPDLSSREEIEKIKALAERAPFPILEGYELSSLSVMHDAKTVAYYLKKEDRLIIFSYHIDPEKDSTEISEKTKLKMRKMIKYQASGAIVSRAKCVVGDADLLVTMRGVDKRELRGLLEDVCFISIDELRG